MIANFFHSIVPSNTPQSFKVQVSSARSATFSWDPPPRIDQNGNITLYVLNITEVETDESFQAYTENTNITIMLKPFSAYICVIAAQNSAGTGPFSSTLQLTTLEEGLWHSSNYADDSIVPQPLHVVILPTAPTSPPYNVTAEVMDSTTIFLMWLPPPTENRNGIIREYLINLEEKETRKLLERTSFSESITVFSLHPYYTYRVQTAAKTIATGPFSKELLLMTPEASRFSISYQIKNWMWLMLPIQYLYLSQGQVQHH